MKTVKHYLITIMLIISQNIAAQDNDRSEYQTQLFRTAIKALESGDYLEAIRTLTPVTTSTQKRKLQRLH